MKYLLTSLFITTILINNFAQTYWARVKSDNEQFYIDATGKKSLDCPFEQCKDFSEGLAIVRDNRWGYIDTKGRIIVPLENKRVNPFHEGLANVDFFFMDKNGRFLFNHHQFEKAYNFSEGVAPVLEGGRWGYINPNGEFVSLPTIYDFANEFSEGLASVKRKDKWYFIDHQYKEVISFKEKVTFAKDFKDGYATIRTDNGWGAINKEGKIVINPENRYLDNIGSGFFRKRLEDQTVVLISAEGKLTKSVDAVREFTEGLLAYRINGKWGYLDTNLKDVIKPSFLNADRFVNGLAPVKQGDLWGYIDKTGNFVISPTFKIAEEFHKID
jgi:hypothetical protein